MLSGAELNEKKQARLASKGVAGDDLAGKTGTTSDYRDAWFLGYTGGFVTAVWVGRDDNTPMRKVTGGGPPAAICAALVQLCDGLALDEVEVDFGAAGLDGLFDSQQSLGRELVILRFVHAGSPCLRKRVF